MRAPLFWVGASVLHGCLSVAAAFVPPAASASVFATAPGFDARVASDPDHPQQTAAKFLLSRDAPAPGLRRDCGYVGIDQYACQRRSLGGRPCVWSPLNVAEGEVGPWCFQGLPEDTARYTLSPDAHELTMTASATAYDEADIDTLTFTTKTFAGGNIVRVTLADKARTRAVVEDAWLRDAKQQTRLDHFDSADDPLKVVTTTSPFSFKVERGDETLFDTTPSTPFMNHLIFQETYMELSTSLPLDAHVFGLGETVRAFRRNPNFTRQTMWARDLPTPKDTNIYGTHPMYMEVRNGKAHGVYLQNAHGMDVVLLPGSLTYKVLGGVFDFWFFAGPTPEAVIQQYMAVIGTPHLPLYWSLGFHHCRYGFTSIAEVRDVWQKYREARIPLETMWTDIECQLFYMDDKRDFTLDPVRFPQHHVNAFVEELHANDQHYVLIIDPAIADADDNPSFVRGEQQDVFLKNHDKSLFKGKVWPGATVFPDFMHPRTTAWWVDEIKRFVDLVPVDGLWIDMNEVANFCDGDCEKPPRPLHDGLDQKRFPNYAIHNGRSDAPLHTGALAVDIQHADGSLEFDRHNLYGFMEANATLAALYAVKPKERAFLLSRSTSPGIGTMVGHWTGDNWSTWEHLWLSIPGMLNFQLFGVPFVGADICGFLQEATEELCARWMSLGAFYPFSRNHNTVGQPGQEPYLWRTVAEASRNALRVRYQLLNHYYTLFWRAHTIGTPVLRALFFDAPDVADLMDVDEQFLVGKAIMVAPALHQGQTSVRVTFPRGRWYDYYTLQEVTQPSAVQPTFTADVPSPLNHIPVFVRGGHVITAQYAGMTVKATRESAFFLVVALDENWMAQGEVYLDDGVTLSDSRPETYIAYTLTQTVASTERATFRLAVDTRRSTFDYKVAPRLDAIHVLGLPGAVTGLRVTPDAHVTVDTFYPPKAHHLSITGLALDMNVPWAIEFNILN